MRQFESQPPAEIVVVIERTARSVAQRRSLEHEKVILDIHRSIEHLPYKPPGLDKLVLKVENSSFLKSSDHPYHEFYRKKRDAYLSQYLDGMIHFRVPNSDDLKLPPDRDDPSPPQFSQPPPEMTPIELGLIKFTAQFVARYGVQFWHALINMYMFPHFSFLKCSDKNFSYYEGLVVLYQRVLKRVRSHVSCADKALGEFFRYLQLEKLPERVIDLHAFVSGFDSMVHDHAPLAMPPPVPLSLMMLSPNQDADVDIQTAELDSLPAYIFPARFSLKELGIIKLTALFAARYGQRFLRALMMREVMNPHFEFLFLHWEQRPEFPSTNSVESRSHVFKVLFFAYSGILKPSKDMDYCSNVALEDFFQLLQLEKLEEGVNSAALIDLHAFVAGVDSLAHMHGPHYSRFMSPPQRLSVMMMNNHPTDILVLLPLVPRLCDRPPRSESLCGSLAYTFPPGISHVELGIIKVTAQFVTMYGKSFQVALLKIAPTDFEFLKVTHSRSGLFSAFIRLYFLILKPSKKVRKGGDCMAKALEFFFNCLQLNKLKKGVATSVIELYAFMSGVDYFAGVDEPDYSAIMAQPERRSVMMSRLHTGDIEPPTLRTPLSFPSASDGFVSPHELGIIKLTAVFVARYGVQICRELMKKVDTKPVLKFMEPSHERFHLYKVAVDAYSQVLEKSEDKDTEKIVERYFQCLEQKIEDDLYGFVEGVDCFVQIEDEYFCKIMGNQLVHLYTCPCHYYDETSSPEPKRQKMDVSARLPEDSSTVKVCVPTVDGRKVIEIRVESLLSEKVASLKEKIGKMIQMPGKELKLRRRSGVLKEDKSLAHNNVEAGEILTLTWRISKWN